MSAQKCPKVKGVTVANQSDEAIYAMVECEKKYSKHVQGGAEFKVVGCGAGANAAAEFDYSIVKPGFSKVSINNYLRFEEVTKEGELVYISIKTEKGDMLTDALPTIVPCGLKVIAGGQVVHVEKGHIWTEVDPRASFRKKEMNNMPPSYIHGDEQRYRQMDITSSCYKC